MIKIGDATSRLGISSIQNVYLMYRGNVNKKSHRIIIDIGINSEQVIEI